MRNKKIFFFLSLLFLLCFSCTRVVDNGNSGGSTNNSGNGDLSQPAYTPPNINVDTLGFLSGYAPISITYNSLSPCATSNETVSFTFNGTNLPSKAKYQWYFGDGNYIKNGNATVSNIYKKSGNYTVTAKMDTDGTVILIPPAIKLTILGKDALPIPNFDYTTLNNTSGGNLIGFNSTSTTTTGSIEKYYWDFGDSSQDSTTGSYVSHSFQQYPSIKTYSVSLAVVDSKGCSSTIKKNVTIPAFR